MDHGGFTKFEVEGAGAGAFLDRVFCGSLPRVGRVKLAYMLTPQGRIWSEATDGQLTVVVEDTGPGFVDHGNQLAFRLFKRFHPPAVAGAGAGLAIVDRIVEWHGGHCELSSTVERGTTVRVTLPVQPVAPVEAAS